MTKLKETIWNFVKTYWPIGVILMVEAVLFLTNYKPGTYLIGWDNLYPELNFPLNIKRSLFGVWQEYRNLGYMDGMSHAANLFHDIFRLGLSLFLPQNLIRWVFVFLMHVVGGIGMYVLLSKYVLKDNRHSELDSESQKAGSRNKFGMTSQLLSIFGALFYQYNLFTIQQFFLPYELFIVHFAFLPWLVHYALSFLDTGKRSHLVWFAIMSFLSIPQAHVPTIFIVYAITLGLLLLIKTIVSKGRALKKVIILVLVTIGINAFWGIPFAYSTLQNAYIVANSKNNQMSTDDIFYRNLKFEDFGDVVQLKGVVLDYWQYDVKSASSHYMMNPWLEYLKTPMFQIPAYLFFILGVIGFFAIFINKRKDLYPVAGVFFFALVMIAGDTPGIAIFSKLMRDYIPLFHNIFRFVFTKFAFLYAFGFTIFLVIGLQTVLKIFRKISIQNLITLVFLPILIIYALPSFQKHFFYENLGAQKPASYFDTYRFFESQDPNTRVATLPIPNYWSWTQNNWNTIGSGFMWYGLPQPTTDRAFDPWSDKNENFYWEFDQAIYSENSTALERVFNKYDISWILYDTSVYNGAAQRFDIDRYIKLLSQSEKISLVERYDFINIYKYDNRASLKDFVGIKQNLPNTKPVYSYDSDDRAYKNYGDYISNSTSTDVYFPFRSLFSGKNTKDLEFTIEEDDENLSFVSKILPGMEGMTLSLPANFFQEFIMYDFDNPENQTAIPVSVSIDGEIIVQAIDPNELTNQFIIQNYTDGELKVSFPKNLVKRYKSSEDPKFLNRTNDGCYKSPYGTATLFKFDNTLKFLSKSSNNCINIDLPSISQRYGYLMSLKTKNSNIKGLYVNVINKGSKKSDLETYLDHDGRENKYNFVLPPRNPYGLGYTLNFNNVSFGREIVENTLKEISIYQIPYHFLKDITLDNGRIFSSRTNVEPSMFEAKQQNYFVYTISFNNTKNLSDAIVYLSQSYDKNWYAFDVPSLTFLNIYLPFFQGKKLEDHVLVNNWANGFLLRPDCTGTSEGQGQCKVVIIFWPQYLEFVGFGLLALTMILITTWAAKHSD